MDACSALGHKGGLLQGGVAHCSSCMPTLTAKGGEGGQATATMCVGVKGAGDSQCLRAFSTVNAAVVLLLTDAAAGVHSQPPDRLESGQGWAVRGRHATPGGGAGAVCLRLLVEQLPAC